MSSASKAQLSDADIKALTASIEAVSSKEKIFAKPALQALLSLINEPTVSRILCEWISQIQATKKVEKVFCPFLPLPVSVRN